MRYVDALLCVAALLVAEWLVVGALSARELVGAYELAYTLGTVVPIGVVAALPIALAGGAIVMGLDGVPPLRARLSVCLPAVALALVVSIGVSGGRLLAGARRPLFVVAVVAAAAAIGWYGTAPAARLLEGLRRRGRLWLLGAVALAVAALEALNLLVWPRLYPAFHLGLSALTLWVAVLASLSWPLQARAGVRRVAAAAVAIASLALSITAPQRMRLYDNIRLIYLERAPTLSHAVRLGALLAPPPPIENGAEVAAPDGVRHLDLGRRDLLLVTIDALRADHVGAYGYGRPTTPALDAIAREGVVFEAAYTATPHTSYAITSLMTGKYMRPLLRQGVGLDSETWAQTLRRYEYRTAAFYPPAAFFVDRERFAAFEQRGLDFEYRKVEFASAAERAEQLKVYLDAAPPDQPLFVWVHLFEPHEPYEPSEPRFGERAIDRYDAEIADADAGLAELWSLFRQARPRSAVIVTADHGEEFGDHGGRYHGTTVYDEQVRVPLVIAAPGLLEPRRVPAVVGLVDLYPTVLRGLGIPLSPRIRGRDLGALLVGDAGATRDGFAFAETDEHTLLARGALRLLCARRIGACRLYDVARDPAQRDDVSAEHVGALADMKRELGSLVASLGRYEQSETAWPQALRRGLAGDSEAAGDVAALLDDVDVRVRRKAAEVLFDLRAAEVAAQLRRALRNDEDHEVRSWSALALTRIEQGAPLTYDLLAGDDPGMRRLAALALAEAGDARGERVLLSWWRAAYPEDPADQRETLPFERAKEVALALARIKSEDAVIPLTWALRDVRLRRWVAMALAEIGEKAARPALAAAFAEERYHDARSALAEALVKLDGPIELRVPLTRFLGVPDPMEGGLDVALRADILQYIGGPRDRELRRLRAFAQSGVAIGVVVPESDHATGGLRVLVRARTEGDSAGEIRFGLRAGGPMSDGDRSQLVPKAAPTFDAALTVTIAVPAGEAPRQLYATLPEAVAARVRPGGHGDFVIYATQNVVVDACAVVPLAAELPPPPPEPWSPEGGGD